MKRNPNELPELLFITGINVTFILKGKLSESEVNGFVDYLNETHNSGRDYFAALLREYGSAKIKIRAIL